MKRLLGMLRGTFFSGLLVLLPAGLTAYILWLLVRIVGGMVGPQVGLSRLLTRAFGRYIPGTEILVTIAVVLLIGAVTRYWLGHRILNLFERTLLALPVLSKIYWATRQLSHAMFKRDVLSEEHVKQIVLVEFPKEGSYVIGILTSDDLPGMDQALGRPIVAVYIPTAPSPLTGYVLFVPKDKIVPVELTMDEGLSLVLSGGVVVPQRLQEKPQARQQGNTADTATPPQD